MPYERELEAARNAAQRAGLFIRAEYESFIPIPDAPVSISTNVDRESQELILKALREAFPEYGLCAEETTDTLTASSSSLKSDRVWVVDPIDGTRGFAMKNGEFSVMIGLLESGEPVLNRETYAVKGQGCWVKVGDGSPQRVRVSSTAELKSASLVQSRSRPGKPSGPAQALKPARLIETYSAGVKLAIVARGEGDLYANSYDKFHDWDICAGHILVTEAGGTVTGLRGQPVHYGTSGYGQLNGLLASNGVIHSSAVALL